MFEKEYNFGDVKWRVKVAVKTIFCWNRQFSSSKILGVIWWDYMLWKVFKNSLYSQHGFKYSINSLFSKFFRAETGLQV